MSTIIRRKRTSRNLGPYRRDELLSGQCTYGVLKQAYTGYGDFSSTDAGDFISEEMKSDWLENRTELLEHWASCGTAVEFHDDKPWLYTRGNFDIFPWAAEQFDDDLEATRREMLAIARRYRQPYEDELHQAESWAKYNRDLVEHPERGGQGTGCDPESRRRALAEAKAAVAYHKALLAELDCAEHE